MSDLVVIVEIRALENDLRVFKSAAVVELDKAESFGIADRSRPTRHRYRLPVVLGKTGINFLQLNSVHPVILPLCGNAQIFASSENRRPFPDSMHRLLFKYRL